MAIVRMAAAAAGSDNEACFADVALHVPRANARPQCRARRYRSLESVAAPAMQAKPSPHFMTSWTTAVDAHAVIVANRWSLAGKSLMGEVSPGLVSGGGVDDPPPGDGFD
jgi:hypothetical protein